MLCPEPRNQNSKTGKQGTVCATEMVCLTLRSAQQDQFGHELVDLVTIAVSADTV